MRIERENGIITLMRGDSLVTPIYINKGSKLQPQYRSLTAEEQLYFGLMEPNQAFEDAVLRKMYTTTSPTDDSGNTLLILSPEDTEKLLVGKYYYMIKLRSIDSFGQSVVRTIVPPTLFWLKGNNPVKKDEQYYEKGDYVITEIILDGGEIDTID